MLTTLKPCPFCSGQGRRKYGRYNLLGAYGSQEQVRVWYAVYCTNCKVSQPSRFYFTREESDAAWNKREERTHGKC